MAVNYTLNKIDETLLKKDILLFGVISAIFLCKISTRSYK